MNSLQKVIILLNFKPFTYFFKAIYAFGLKQLIHNLKNHPAVHSIYGCGSFFDGECLYGLSDIDLILVIDEPYTRADEDPYRMTETYNWVRRFFPFLGNWSEKGENLIFLSEVRSGFPVPESFRLGWKQGRLFHLDGKSFPKELVTGPVSLSEVVTEMDTLLRMTITKGEVHTSNLLFWKRFFTKLIDLTDTLGLTELAKVDLGPGEMVSKQADEGRREENVANGTKTHNQRSMEYVPHARRVVWYRFSPGIAMNRPAGANGACSRGRSREIDRTSCKDQPCPDRPPSVNSSGAAMRPFR